MSTNGSIRNRSDEKQATLEERLPAARERVREALECGGRVRADRLRAAGIKLIGVAAALVPEKPAPEILLCLAATHTTLSRMCFALADLTETGEYFCNARAYAEAELTALLRATETLEAECRALSLPRQSAVGRWPAQAAGPAPRALTPGEAERLRRLGLEVEADL